MSEHFCELRGGRIRSYTMFEGTAALTAAHGRLSTMRRKDRFVFDRSWLEDVSPPRRPLLLFDGG